MKIKNLWLPVIILTLIGGTAKICDTLFNVHGEGFFFGSGVCNAIVIASIVLILIIGHILSLFDKKKYSEAVPLKNTTCGVFGFIASVMILGGGILSIITIGSQPFAVLNIVTCILTLIGGGVLLFESCISFTGQNGIKKFPLLSLAVPLYICIRFINIFLQYMDKSIGSTEIFDIIAVALLLMFFMYQSMFFAEINTTLAVRKATVYGCAYIMCGLIAAIDILIKMTYPAVESNIDTEIVEPAITTIISCIGDIALCGYAVCFIKSAQKSVVKSLHNIENNVSSEEESFENDKADAVTDNTVTAESDESNEVTDNSADTETDESNEVTDNSTDNETDESNEVTDNSTDNESDESNEVTDNSADNETDESNEVTDNSADNETDELNEDTDNSADNGTDESNEDTLRKESPTTVNVKPVIAIPIEED